MLRIGRLAGADQRLGETSVPPEIQISPNRSMAAKRILWPFRFTTGSIPLRKSKFPTSEDSTQAPKDVGGAGSTIPSSLTRELGPPATGLLPLGAGMCSSINSNVFAIHHWCRFQIEHSIHDFGDLNQSRNRVERFQELMVVVGVHRRVNNARGD